MQVCHEHAIWSGVAPEPTAPDAAPDATPKPKAIEQPEPKAVYGPNAPDISPEAAERLRRAQQLRDEQLEEQRRHAAEANYGYPTSARPRPIGPPAAKKSPAFIWLICTMQPVRSPRPWHTMPWQKPCHHLHW